MNFRQTQKAASVRGSQHTEALPAVARNKYFIAPRLAEEVFNTFNIVEVRLVRNDVDPNVVSLIGLLGREKAMGDEELAILSVYASPQGSTRFVFESGHTASDSCARIFLDANGAQFDWAQLNIGSAFKPAYDCLCDSTNMATEIEKPECCKDDPKDGR